MLLRTRKGKRKKVVAERTFIQALDVFINIK